MVLFPENEIFWLLSMAPMSSVATPMTIAMTMTVAVTMTQVSMIMMPVSTNEMTMSITQMNLPAHNGLAIAVTKVARIRWIGCSIYSSANISRAAIISRIAVVRRRNASANQKTDDYCCTR